MRISLKPALWVFLAALMLRWGWSLLIYFWHPNGFLVYDSWGYLNIAYSMYHFGVYSQMTVAPWVPDASRTPLYPALILLFHHLQLGLIWIVVVQSVLSAATAAVWWLCIKNFLKTAPLWLKLWAAIWLIADIPAWVLASTIGTETLFTLLLALFVFTFLRFYEYRQLKYALLSSTMLALAALCRPIALCPALIYPFVLLLVFGTSWWRSKWALLMVLLVCGPWFVRNKSVFGDWFYSSVSSINLLFHTSAGVLAQVHQTSRAVEDRRMRSELLGDLDFNQPAAIPAFNQRTDSVFKEVVRSHPYVFFEQWIKGVLYFFVKPMRSYVDHQLGIEKEYRPVAPVGVPLKQTPEAIRNHSFSTVSIAVVLLQVLWLLGVFAGLLFFLLNIKIAEPPIMFLLALLVYFAWISGLTEADARLRMPLHGILVFLSVWGIVKFSCNKSITS